MPVVNRMTGPPVPAAAAAPKASVSKRAFQIAFIAMFVTWTFFIYEFPPTLIVDYLGVSNGYAGAFVLAALGSLSTFISFPYHLIVVTLGAGGLNPFGLGLSAAAGVFISDSASYLIGYKGRDILPARMERIFQTLCGWCLTRPSWLVPLTLFSYGAAVPFSDDFIVISMGLVRYPFWKLMIPLGLGNIVFNTGAALLGAYGYASLFE